MTISFSQVRGLLKRARREHKKGEPYPLDSLERHIRSADPDDLGQLNNLMAEADGPGRGTILNLINEFNRKRLVTPVGEMEWKMQELAPYQSEPQDGRGWTLLTPVAAVDAELVTGGQTPEPSDTSAALTPRSSAHKP